jgi:hypothetical protein
MEMEFSEMTNVAMIGRVSVGVVGAVLLVGVAGAAFADEEPYGSDDVEVSVEIAEADEPGILAMTVDGDSAVLVEDGSTGTIRQFTGTLPTVTVTDTRVFPDRIDPSAFWYVLGTSSSFVGDGSQPDITADHLGWTPALVGDTDPGEVAAGDQVDTVMDGGDDNVGLVDQEFLAVSAPSGGINPTGSWSVNAELFLKTPITVEPGSYTSTLTLSLFEYSD